MFGRPVWLKVPRRLAYSNLTNGNRSRRPRFSSVKESMLQWPDSTCREVPVQNVQDVQLDSELNELNSVYRVHCGSFNTGLDMLESQRTCNSRIIFTKSLWLFGFI